MSGKKSFAIHSFRSQYSSDNGTMKRQLNILSNAIDEIYNKNASLLSFEELYRNAYNLVLQKNGAHLYSAIAECIRRHLDRTVQVVSEASNEEMIRAVVNAWTDHKIAFDMIKDILMYMDRTYVVPHKKLPVYYMALELFRDVVYFSPSIRDRLKIAVLNEVSNDRKGLIVDRGLVRTVLEMLVDLSANGSSLYDIDFEQQMLDESRDFFRIQSLERIPNMHLADFLILAEQQIQEEMARAQVYFPVSSKEKIRDVVETEWVTAHGRYIMDFDRRGDLSNMMDAAQKIADLKRLFMMMNRIPSCTSILHDGLQQYYTLAVSAIVDDTEISKAPLVYVAQLLDLQDRMNLILKDAFRSDPAAQRIMKNAFESVLNRDNRCASYLATYLDDVLRSGLRGGSSVSSEDAMEVRLEKVIVLFKYLIDKDIFENFYKTLLSKRLLSGKSISDEVEKAVISKLKAECGYQFTAKLEGMFVDMTMSKTVMDEFRNSPFYRFSTENFELDVQTLTAGCWPVQSIPACRMPPVVAAALGKFSTFYLQKHNGRKLSWVTHLGSVDIKATFPSGRTELSASVYQACILNLFNAPASISPSKSARSSKSSSSSSSSSATVAATVVGGAAAAAAGGGGGGEEERIEENVEVPDTGKNSGSRSSISSASSSSSSSAGVGVGGVDADGSLSYEEIAVACEGIPELECKRHLLSLCTPKLRILKKSSKGKGIDVQDRFSFNFEFTSKLKRVRVPLVAMKDVLPANDGENGVGVSSSSALAASGLGIDAVGPDGVPLVVEEDRRHIVEAAIVRIMKSRKNLAHNELVGEVCHQLTYRFSPNPQFIKKRIEALIERDFLERDKNDQKLYNYLA